MVAGDASFGSAEYFAGDGGDFAVAHEEKAQQVMTGFPSVRQKVDVRHQAGHCPDLQEGGGDSVGNDGPWTSRIR